MMKRLFFLIIICISLSNILAQTYSISSIPSEIKNRAKAVVRLNHIELELKNYNQLQIKKTLVITIFKKDGDEFQYLPMFYDKHTKIQKYGGEVYDADGKVLTKFKKKDYRDYSAVQNGALYTDDRVMVYEYTPTQYPYTIKHEISYETSNTAFLPDWNPVSTYEIGVENSIYSFVNKSDVNIRTKDLNFNNDFNITKTEFDNGFEYNLINLKPLHKEVLSPELANYTPRLLVTPQKFQLAGHDGEFSNWNEFGKWMYHDLIDGKQELPAAEIDKINELIASVHDTKEKVRILYQYMQEKTRYINVAIGIGGWQPYPAMDVSSKGYGDCKALSNYMMSLLKEANISSNYTVVYGDSESKRDIRPDFPSLQGNHVILQVPLDNDTIWLECTSQKAAFNHLGRFTADRYALAINPEGGKIVRTQTTTSNQNKEVISGQAKIDDKGSLDLKFKSISSGIQYDHNYYAFYQTKQEQQNWLESKYYDITSKNFISSDFIHDQDNAQFIQDIHLSSDAYTQISGNNLIFPLLPIGKHQTRLKKDSFRKLPIQIDYGYSHDVIFSIDIPQSYKLNYDIDPIELSSEFGTYSLNVTQENSQLIVSRSLLTHAGTFPKEKYMEYVEFRRNIEKADNTKILLEKQ
ncbi:DUF3857 domain-containing protein [Weeksellaceae bacterium KMM 9713]|uniref:DUF3857 domain-containing protein n=1 Tax=Profundicola chukchiensis TaxID=2961959 RepID=A0A9X4MYQ2_9FLAO|nr:DUF3857 domain-containing protein [Profundicola chukchiensis]MDG4945302.1 DUF3857 domain-containing protein [Profundicola chukchiensis]